MEIEAKGAEVHRVADVKDFLVAYNEVSGAAKPKMASGKNPFASKGAKKSKGC